MSTKAIWTQSFGAQEICDGLIETAAMEVRDARIIDDVEVVGVEGNGLADQLETSIVLLQVLHQSIAQIPTTDASPWPCTSARSM